MFALLLLSGSPFGGFSSFVREKLRSVEGVGSSLTLFDSHGCSSSHKSMTSSVSVLNKLSLSTTNLPRQHFSTGHDTSINDDDDDDDDDGDLPFFADFSPRGEARCLTRVRR